LLTSCENLVPIGKVPAVDTGRALLDIAGLYTDYDDKRLTETDECCEEEPAFLDNIRAFTINPPKKENSEELEVSEEPDSIEKEL
tara:strand:- start:1204 stop:1458 length:255 start_codon:yes stop_codon:yes gene_type:complete